MWVKFNMKSGVIHLKYLTVDLDCKIVVKIIVCYVSGC